MPFHVDGWELLAASLVMASGALLQGCVGFGYALIAAPLLTLLGPHWVPGPLIFGAISLTLGTWRREWGQVLPEDRRQIIGHVGWAMVGRVPGVVLGAWILANIPMERMGVLVGLLVLVAVGLSLVTRPFHPNRRSLLAAGTVSGVLGTVASVGGPPMALLFQWQSPSRIRVTLAVFFTFGAVMSLVGLMVIHRFGWAELLLGILVTPGTQLGFQLSSPLVGRLDRQNMRPLVLSLAALSALAALLHGLSHPAL